MLCGKYLLIALRNMKKAYAKFRQCFSFAFGK